MATNRAPRASVRWVAASSSEPNWANASRSRYWASSSFSLPATLRMALIWAEPPTRLTEMPTFRAGRTPEKKSLLSRKICPSVIEITLVGMYADTSPACVSMIGSAVSEPPPRSSLSLQARSSRREWR